MRLAILVALALLLVIGATTYWETRTFESVLERELHHTAQSTAEAVADDLELRREPLAPAELHAMLHEFIEAVPALRRVTVATFSNPDGEVLASTSSGDHAEDLNLARRAAGASEAIWSDTNTQLPRVAVPLDRDGRRIGAVVVTVSFGPVSQLRTRGRLFGAGFSIAAIILATLVIDFAARRVVHGPLANISRTMERVGSGDLTARAPAVRRDEIGTIAMGLNQMLAELEHHHVALQERVREATDELRIRNEELVQDYHRILALREALARAEQMAAVGQMAANVAHQIGTPLNLISGYVQLMKEHAGADLARLQVVEEQIAKVAAIVRTLLDRGRLSAPRELVDPADLIHRVCDLARPNFEAIGVGLDISIGEMLPPLLADTVQLELALMNVVANALDAMRSGGTLTIRAGAISDNHSPALHTHGTWIEISDTGPGISSALLPRIFEPWLTTKPPGSGTGLGLSITKEVVSAHGGSISAANLPGGGAIFRIDLPASVPHAINAAQVPVRVM